NDVMHKIDFVRPTVLFAAMLISIAALSAKGSEATPDHWNWQEPQADVDAKGNLTWKPRPFAFEKGGSVRYIDFDAGDDTNSGETLATPWKHHPWDPNSTGKSAQGSGVHTYVFKRG